MFTPRELRHSLQALAAWNQRFEVPDVIGFQDYLAFQDHLAVELATGAPVCGPASVQLFPYPTARGGLRWFTVLPLEDLLLARAAAGRVLPKTEAVLSSRVHSCRLQTGPPGWRFRDHGLAHRGFRREALSMTAGASRVSMCRTDVRDYFGSVDPGRLIAWLERLGCDGSAVSFLSTALRRWSTMGIAGLPVGPEASGALANAFLAPADHRLEALGIPHLRWMDDFLLFDRGGGHCRSLVSSLDEELSKLGLERSAAKTRFFEGGEQVALALHGDPNPSLSVRTGLDEEPGRRPLNGAWLCGDAKRMNVDPMATARYLAETSMDDGRVIDGITKVLARPPAARSDGLKLHLLRAMTVRGWGEIEGRVFHRLATDRTERPPVRAWAWKALSRTPVWSYEEVVGSMSAESEGIVRRSMLASCAGAAHSARSSGLLRHLEERFPDLRYTARWVRQLQGG